VNIALPPGSVLGGVAISADGTIYVTEEETKERAGANIRVLKPEPSDK
jgi:hypothetical protein